MSRLSSQPKFYDLAEWPMQRSPRPSVSTASSVGRGEAFWNSTDSQGLSTPLTTPPSSLSKPPQSEFTKTLLFTSPITVSYTKGTSVFKAQYARADVCKDAAGGLRCLELSDHEKREHTLIHAFPNSKLPIPHLERPYTSSQRSSFRVSFLEEQTVQTAGMLFQGKPDYTFEKWEDCKRFQEAILSQAVLFSAGIAEAKSKGRGEECISQNVRVLKSRTDRQSILLFANSQRKEKKRYISVPLDSIEHIDAGKKASKPVTLKLGSDTEMTTALKVLTIQFLDEADHIRFCTILQQGCSLLSR